MSRLVTPNMTANVLIEIHLQRSKKEKTNAMSDLYIDFLCKG